VEPDLAGSLLPIPFPLACSYRPGGSEVGIEDSWSDITAFIRCIPMAKSVESRVQQF